MLKMCIETYRMSDFSNLFAQFYTKGIYYPTLYAILIVFYVDAFTSSLFYGSVGIRQKPILRDKTMDDKLLFIPKDTQSYPSVD